jgi:hypothetical protein
MDSLQAIDILIQVSTITVEKGSLLKIKEIVAVDMAVDTLNNLAREIKEARELNAKKQEKEAEPDDKEVLKMPLSEKGSVKK